MRALLALGAAAVVVATGLEPLTRMAETWTRTWPILAFLLLGSLVAELCDEAGLFDRAAHLVARAGAGHRRRLFLLACALAVAVTVVLGLDTTAVLLTPVLLTLAATVGVEARPFAYACVWLANAGSLLLPVSNLTNLLAQDRLGLDAAGFVRLSWAPSLATVAVVVAYALLRWRAPLRGGYTMPARAPRGDGVLLAAAAAAVAGFAAAVLLGVAAWLAAGGAAIGLVAAFAIRAPRRVSPPRLVRLLPLDLAGFALGLFVVVGAVGDRLGGWLGAGGPGAWGPVALAGGAAVAANLVDNLPAYLALEGLVGDAHRLMAVLVGVNAGPLVLAWGSLANLLWLDRCRARGLTVRHRDLAREGWPVAVLAVLAGALALAATG